MNDLKFTKTHEWLKQEADEVTIGITDHAQELLGDMVYIELPELGASFNIGDELGVVESVKAASDFYAPISGTVTAVNDAVIENPDIVNHSPYSSGWLVKMKAHQLIEIDSLLNWDQYQNEIAEDK